MQRRRKHLGVEISTVHGGFLIPVLCVLPDEIGAHASRDSSARSIAGSSPELCHTVMSNNAWNNRVSIAKCEHAST